MVRKTQIQLLQAAKAELEANVPTSSLIADIAYVLKEPELPFTDGYTPPSLSVPDIIPNSDGIKSYPLTDLYKGPPPTPGTVTEEDLINAAKFIRDSSKPYDYYLNKAKARGPVAPVSLPVDKQFDGVTYDEDLDKERLSKQLDRIFEYMKGAEWHTLHDIHIATGAPEASASACLRDFRKARNGAHTVERRRKGIPTTGVHEYKLLINTGTA